MIRSFAFHANVNTLLTTAICCGLLAPTFQIERPANRTVLFVRLLVLLQLRWAQSLRLVEILPSRLTLPRPFGLPLVLVDPSGFVGDDVGGFATRACCKGNGSKCIVTRGSVTSATIALFIGEGVSDSLTPVC